MSADPLTETAPPAPLPRPLPRPKGILCPNCGTKLESRRTFPRRDNSIRRQRRCGGCGYQCVTWERVKGAT